MTLNSATAASTAAIVQARMGSSRHPGKTLEPLGDRRVLDWVVARLAAANHLDEVIVATTDLPGDDVIVDALSDSDAPVVRGSSDDVLDRYRVAAERTGAEVIVRITADCPLIDPAVVDLAVQTLLDSDADYVSTSLDGRFPRGFDAEAFRRSALLDAAAEAEDQPEREHVTLFIYRRPERFRCLPVVAPEWARHPELRLTLDEEDDLRLLRAIVDRMPASIDTSGEQIVDFLLEHPEVADINANVAHRYVE